MKKIERFITKLQEKLIPIGSKIAGQRHLQAISSGMISTLPLTFIGAIFMIIANPAVTPEMAASTGFFEGFFRAWFNFSQTYKTFLITPYNLTMNILSLVVCFSVAYNLAKSYKMNTLTSSMLALATFLMIAAPFETYEGMTIINPTNLGTPGLFAAMLVAVASVEISRFCATKNIQIKLPNSIPSNIAASFSSIIPLLLNIVIIYGINILLIQFTGTTLVDVLIVILTPAISGINSFPGVLLLVTFAMLLWFFGIHGMSIMFSIIAPIFMIDVAANVELVALGQTAVLTPSMIAYYYVVSGGSGATLGLTFMMLRSKSEQLKLIGKVAIVPNIFSINEPVIFGTPIMLNPIMFIPFICAPIVVVSLTYIAGQVGFLPGMMMYIGGFFPVGVSESLTSLSIRPLIWCWILVVITSLIWYPFFKVLEKKYIEEEALADTQS